MKSEKKALQLSKETLKSLKVKTSVKAGDYTTFCWSRYNCTRDA